MITMKQSWNTPQINFGEKIRTRDAILLTSGPFIAIDSPRTFEEAASIVAGRKIESNELFNSETADKIKAGLIEQFPILACTSNNMEAYLKCKRTAEDIKKYVDKQVEYVGEKELDVEPLNI